MHQGLKEIGSADWKSIIGQYDEDIIMMMYDDVVIAKKSELMSDDFPLI